MPEFSRRSMIAKGLGALGSVTLGSAALGSTSLASLATGVPAASATPAPDEASALRRSTFLPHVKGTVTAEGSPGRYRLRLVEILDLSPATVVDDEHAFNLIFEQSEGRPASEGIYALSATGMVECTLHLSAVEGPGVGRRLQALVNRRPA